MTKTTKTVYVTSDKQEFSSEAEAQAHEIARLFGDGDMSPEAASKHVVSNKDAILSILGAKRRTRSDKGKSRKVKGHKLSSTILDADSKQWQELASKG